METPPPSPPPHAHTSPAIDCANSIGHWGRRGRVDGPRGSSPRQSPSPSKSRSPSPRLLSNRCITAGGNIRQSLSPTDLHSPAGPCLRVTRDSSQPATGSLSDIRRSETTEAEEEDETFDDFPEAQRPRAFTCPVTRAFNRKLKARMLNRPPTPTYRDLTQEQTFDFQSLDLNDLEKETGERRLSSGPPELEAIQETQ